MTVCPLLFRYSKPPPLGVVRVQRLCQLNSHAFVMVPVMMESAFLLTDQS